MIDVFHVSPYCYDLLQVWPYGMFPHPMITGQVFAMAVLHIGLFTHAQGGGYPLLLPIHCVLYLTHMVQEIYDIWQVRIAAGTDCCY